MAQERIDIIVRENGSRVVKRNLEEIGGAGQKAATGMQTLQRAMLGLGLGVTAAGLMRLADSYTSILNRLRLVTTGTENLAAVNDRLFASANRTYASYSATAELYGSLARASDRLGLSQSELLDITENINMAIAISGTEAATAANGLRQLGQGLASGTLRGDELNSVLENMPRLASAIANGMGVGVGELRALAAEGKITAKEVTDALKAAGPELQAEFAQIEPTIANTFTVLVNGITRFIGELNNSTAIGATFGRAILFIADNLDAIATAAAFVGVAFMWSSASGAIAAVLGPMIALQRALGATSTMAALYSIAMKIAQGATRGLTIALLANPFTALIAAVGLAVTAIIMFGDEVAVTADGAVSLKDAFFGALLLIWDLVKIVAGAFLVAWDSTIGVVSGLLGSFGLTWSDVFGFIWDIVKGTIDLVVGTFVFAYTSIAETWNNFPGFMNALFTGVVNLAISAAESVLNAWQTPLRFIAAGLGKISDEAGASLSGFLDNTNITIPRAQLNAAGKAYVGAIEDGARSSFSGGYADSLGAAIIARSRGLGGDSLNPGGDAVAGSAAAGDKAKAAKDAGKPEETRTEFLTRMNAEQSRAIGLARILDPELRKVEEAVLGVNDQMREKDWSVMNAAEELALRDLITLKEKENRIAQVRDNIMQEARAPQRAYEDHLAASESLLKANVITLERYNEELRNARITLLATKTDMASGMELGRLQTEKDNGDVGGRVASLYQSEWNAANAPLRDIAETQAVLNQLLSDDKITNGQYAQRMSELSIEAAILRGNMPDATLLDGARAGLARFAADFKGVLPGLASAWGNWLQKIGDGFANTIGRAIVYGENLGDTLAEVGRSAMAELISGLIKLGIQWLITQIIGQTAQKAITATGNAAAAATATAWAPAAAMVSLATFGANGVPAGLAIAAVNAISLGLAQVGGASKGFREGGYTGDLGLNEVAGVVHGKEFVVNAEATGAWLPLLEQINSGRMPGYRKGGLVGGSSMSMGSRGSIDLAGATAGGDSIHISIDARGAESGVEEKIGQALNEALPVFLAKSRKQEEKVQKMSSGRQRIGSN